MSWPSTMFRRAAMCVLLLVVSCAHAAAQRYAVIAPDDARASLAFSERVTTELARKHEVLDASMVRPAFSATRPDDPYNMTRENARTAAAAIGCDVFVLVRAATVRRSSSARSEYYEAAAFIYLVSARSGRLVLWKGLSYDDTTPAAAEEARDRAVPPLAEELQTVWAKTAKAELAEPEPARIEEAPEGEVPKNEWFRAPIPYRRIKPDYTSEAAFYDVEATVDIQVDLAADGTIIRTEIDRWAGFGLDESVERAVRSMNWRPAERKGKQQAMRFLLRYNFRETK